MTSPSVMSQSRLGRSRISASHFRSNGSMLKRYENIAPVFHFNTFSSSAKSFLSDGFKRAMRGVSARHLSSALCLLRLLSCPSSLPCRISLRSHQRVRNSCRMALTVFVAQIDPSRPMFRSEVDFAKAACCHSTRARGRRPLHNSS